MRTLRISRIKEEAFGIRSYEFIDTEGVPLPSFEAGAHIDLHLAGNRVRSYSICNDPQERNRYLIAVLREPAGRGGSVYVHENFSEGMDILISEPRNNFQLKENAAHHIFIAGGIGITPILAMARHLENTGGKYSLHYCARDSERAAFCDLLMAPPFDRRTLFHFDGGEPRRGLDVVSLLRQQREGQHVYCCGPAGLIEAVKIATASWTHNTVHFELFKAQPTLLTERTANSSFEVEIGSTGQVFNVPPHKSILQVLRENGISRSTSCEEGVCGTCTTGLLDGKADHRDFILTEDEKASQTEILVCCSRALTKRLRLDL